MTEVVVFQSALFRFSPEAAWLIFDSEVLYSVSQPIWYRYNIEYKFFSHSFLISNHQQGQKNQDAVQEVFLLKSVVKFWVDYLVMSKEVELHQDKENLGNVQNMQRVIGTDRWNCP